MTRAAMLRGRWRWVKGSAGGHRSKTEAFGNGTPVGQLCRLQTFP